MPASLTEQIPQLFASSQHSLSSHRKNAATLKKLRQVLNKAEFDLSFYKCLNVLLATPKKEAVGDRVSKFIAYFVKLHEEPAQQTLLITELFGHLLRGVEVKKVMVRYRVLQLLNNLLSSSLATLKYCNSPYS